MPAQRADGVGVARECGGVFWWAALGSVLGRVTWDDKGEVRVGEV